MGGAPRDVFEDLRRLGELKRTLLAGQPSDRALAKAAGVSPTTVGAWLRGQQFPQSLDALLRLIGVIRGEADRRGLMSAPVEGAAGESVAELLAGERWRAAFDAEQTRRAQAASAVAERGQAQEALARQERLERQAAVPDGSRPVRSWTAQRLGVHPAISGRPAPQDDAGFVLPSYVARRHDDRLRAHLTTAVAPGARPVLVVVRGASCTGKTRTAVEAVGQTVPEEWELVFPADASSLQAVLAADALLPHTVLWLNEAQNYLTGPDGEAAAKEMLRRLDGDGPLIVIATLWPDYDEALTNVPGPRQADPHRHARALLAQAHRVFVRDSFAEDLDAVRGAAGQDRSLAAAVQTGTSSITQVLAAGPDLVEHYEHPAGEHGCYGKALLSAAMDAHRLGVAGPLPLTFLQDAAPGYLTADQRAAADPGTWFAGALTHARTRIKNVTSPLREVPHPSEMGAVPGVVRLADYLQQHGRHTRSALCPPATFLTAAADHLTDPADLAALADSAQRRYRYRHAAVLYCAAADAGNRYALVDLARLREMAGDRDDAERLYRTAADAGNPDALAALAWLREKAGDRDDAERLYRTAADAGNHYALAALARLREAAGDRDDAERLYRAAVDAGNPDALAGLAGLVDGWDWEHVLRYGLEADGSPAGSWSWPEPRVLGEGG